MPIPAWFTLSLSVIAVGLALGAPAYGQSLKEAVEQTLQTNPDILMDASKRLSTDEALKGARGGYLPKVDLGMGTGRERSNNASTLGSDRTLTRREASLTLTQMLFDGFGVSSEVNRNRARVESAAHKVAGTSEQIGLQAIEAYLEVLRQHELVELTRHNLTAHERTLNQIKVRAESGVGRKADFEQIQARFGLAKANFTAAEANLRDAETNFLRVVGASPADLSKPNGPERNVLPKSMDEAVQMAFDNNPTLKSANADVEAADAQNNAAKSFMYPRFDLELGATQNEDTDGVLGGNDEQYAMLRMRYNLFKGGSDNARVNETAQLANEAHEIMRRTQQQLEQSTRLSWNAKVSASERLPSLKQHADSSLATRDAYTKQFSIGQRTLLDMLDSENEYFTAGSNYVNGQYVELFANYRILTDMGQLLSALGVASREEAMITEPRSRVGSTTKKLLPSSDRGLVTSGFDTAGIPVNDAPVAATVTASGAEDAASITVTLSGTDVDGRIASYTVKTLPTNGLLFTDAALTAAVVVNAVYPGATLYFVPAANFNGTADFTYTVTDAEKLPPAEKEPVIITPVAATVTASGAEDAASITVTLSGTDVDGRIASYTVKTLPTNGLLFTDAALTAAVVVNAVYPGATLYFVPAADFNGTADFTYTVTDK